MLKIAHTDFFSVLGLAIIKYKLTEKRLIMKVSNMAYMHYNLPGHSS